MGELVTAMVYTIGRYVTMLFTLQIDPNISVGSFLLALAILGALIKLIFSLVKVPGGKWIAGYQSFRSRRGGDGD